jgi:flagellar export protein FliJ
MASKSERFASLGKIQQQHYERALQAEREAEQVVADIDASIAKVREYQQDYQNNLLELQQNRASSDQLMRMRTFIQQLMQMEVEQQRQRTEAQQRVQELHEKTLQQLKKVKINDKLVEQAEAEQLVHAKQQEAKQMDAVATSLFLRRASGA